MPSLSRRHIDALRYYVGEPNAYRDYGLPSDPKAYNTLNALFFPGISTERARAKEGKQLNPDFLNLPYAIVAFFLDLLQALIIGGQGEPEAVVYRVDREADVAENLKEGCTISFTSTSETGFLQGYTDKNNLALMEIHLPAGCPRADMGKLLPGYTKPEEAETLLPPWMPLIFRRRPLSQEEKTIRDKNGKQPVSAWVVTADNAIARQTVLSCIPTPMIYPLSHCAIYDKLNSGEEPTHREIAEYENWKAAIIANVAYPQYRFKAS